MMQCVSHLPCTLPLASKMQWVVFSEIILEWLWPDSFTECFSFQLFPFLLLHVVSIFLQSDQMIIEFKLAMNYTSPFRFPVDFYGASL